MQNLSWDVIERPLFSNFKKIEGYKVLHRSDTDEVLHIARKTYTPTTNARFLETVSALNKITGFPVEMIDEIDNGKKVIAFLKCTNNLTVQGYEFKDWLMLGNSHDGSTGLFIGNSNMMIRCSNRFTQNFRQFQIYHTKHHDFKIDYLLDGVSSYHTQRQKFYDSMGDYVNFEITQTHKNNLVHLLADYSPAEILNQSEISTRKLNIATDLHNSINRECHALGDNLFGLFNGATHYTTHTKKSNVITFGNSFGIKAELNKKALNFCNQLINI